MNTYYKLITLAIGLFLALSASASAAPGDLDSTFGNGGKVITVLPGNNRAHSAAVQPDGKIVVHGGRYSGTSEPSFLIRYNPNGTLDNSFGTNGMVVMPSPTIDWFSYYSRLAILPDGKILVSGTSGPYHGLAIFRFNSNGSPDTSFGVKGVVAIRVGYALDYTRTLAVQPDGKVIVIGSLCDCSDEYDPLGVSLARFNANGSLDTSYGINGIQIITTNPQFEVSDAEILPDGKLLMIGSGYSNTSRIFLSRINANGTPDSSFGTDGVLSLTFEQPQNFASQFAIQPDGKIIFTTENYSSENSQTSTIVRLNPNGAFDVSFGTNGKVIIPESEGIFSRAVLLQPDGKILAGGFAGYTTLNTPYGFGIIRLNADGSRDASFGLNGIVTTFLNSSVNSVADLVLQPDGKLVAYGLIQTFTDYNIGMARYILDSSRSTLFDFDGDGRSDISVFRPSERVWYLNRSMQGFSAIQFGLPSDKITPADFDGDEQTDISVFRDGTWYWLNSSNGNFNTVQFGLANDIPVPADFTGDGRAELAVYRGGNWFTLNLANNQFNAVQFGISTDKPVVGDYDGDNRADHAVYRDGVWYLLQSTQGFAAVQFGIFCNPRKASRRFSLVFRPTNLFRLIMTATAKPIFLCIEMESGICCKARQVLPDFSLD